MSSSPNYRQIVLRLRVGEQPIKWSFEYIKSPIPNPFSLSLPPLPSTQLQRPLKDPFCNQFRVQNVVLMDSYIKFFWKALVRLITNCLLHVPQLTNDFPQAGIHILAVNYGNEGGRKGPLGEREANLPPPLPPKKNGFQSLYVDVKRDKKRKKGLQDERAHMAAKGPSSYLVRVDVNRSKGLPLPPGRNQTAVAIKKKMRWRQIEKGPLVQGPISKKRGQKDVFIGSVECGRMDKEVLDCIETTEFSENRPGTGAAAREGLIEFWPI